MPIYDYECRRHGEFRNWASLADFDKAVPCPVCSKPAARSVSAAYLGMDSQLRKAFGSSEKSAHEPRVVRRRRGDPIPVHDAHSDLSKVRGHGHAHGHGGRHQSTGHEHVKTVRSKHPWLVRH
jgi:putative FmdB family regulatory protein